MKRHWHPEELFEHWTLLADDMSLVGNKTGATRLGFAIILKAFQLEGRFLNDTDIIPQSVVDYVANQVDVPATAFADYDLAGRTARYHRAQIRTFFNFREATRADGDALVQWLSNQDLILDTTMEALLVVAYERYRELRIEPPTSDRMHRLTRSAIRLAEKQFTETILGRLSENTQTLLDALLEDEVKEDTKDDNQITWYRLKSDPGKVSLQNLLYETAKLDLIHQLDLPKNLLADISPKVIKRYRERAGVETMPQLRQHTKALRLTLLAVLCWQRSFEIVDGIVDMMLGLVHRIGTRAEKKVQKKILADIVRISGKNTILFQVAEAAVEHPDDAVSQIIYPAAGGKKILEALIKEHNAGQSYQYQVLNTIRRSYQSHVRRMIAPVQKAITFKSNEASHQPILKALEVIKTYTESRSVY